MSTSITGECLCGKTSLTSKSSPDKFGSCHCAMCRKWAGGPALEVKCDQGVELSGTENIGIYDSSEWAERGFCKNCGTHLFYRLKKENTYHVPLGLFGDQLNPEFDTQVYIDKKPDYYNFSEETTNYTEAQVIEMYGGD